MLCMECLFAFSFFQRLHPTVPALAKYIRIVFVSQALNDFVLKGFSLTFFLVGVQLCCLVHT